MDGFWDFFWLMVVGFLFFAWIMVLLQILVDLFRDRSVNGWVKAIWVVCLIFIPFLTALIYLIARGGGMAERSMESNRQMQQQTDEYIRTVAGGGKSAAEQIAHGKELLDSGAITQQEFETLKAKALSS